MENNNKIFYGWWIVGTAFVALFGGLCAGFYTVSVFLEPLQSEFGWSKTQISFGFMCSALFSGVLSPFTGLAVSKFGVRRIQITGAVIISSAMIMISMMTSLWHYYLLLILQAAGLSFVGIIPCQTAVSDWFDKKRGFAMGIIMAGVGSGGMVMIFIASLALDEFGWRGAYRLLACIVIFIVFPTIYFLMKNKPEDLGLAIDGMDALEYSESLTFGAVPDESLPFKSVPFWLLCSLMLFFGIVVGALTQHSIALLNSLNVQNSSGYWSLALGVSVLGRLLFGKISDTVSKKKLLILCWVFVFAGLCFLFLVSKGSLYVFCFSTLYGISLGAFITLMPLFLGEIFGVENFSRLIGLVQLFLVVGIALGTIIMGKTFDISGSYFTGIKILLFVVGLGFVANILISTGSINNKLQDKWNG